MTTLVKRGTARRLGLRGRSSQLTEQSGQVLPLPTSWNRVRAEVLARVNPCFIPSQRRDEAGMTENEDLTPELPARLLAMIQRAYDTAALSATDPAVLRHYGFDRSIVQRYIRADLAFHASAEQITDLEYDTARAVASVAYWRPIRDVLTGILRDLALTYDLAEQQDQP